MVAAAMQTWPQLASLVAAGAIGVGVGFNLRRVAHLLKRWQWQRQQLRAHADVGSDSDADSNVSDSDADEDEEYRMMLVVRNDLKMGKGKIGAQCGHAVVGAYKLVRRCSADALRKWEWSGQAKICVKVNSEEEMCEVEYAARARGLPTHVVHDAGRTQIAAGSKTVLAIGPAKRSRLDPVTSHLKLL